MNAEVDEGAVSRRGKAMWVVGGVGAVGLILLGVWTQRAPIAENFIARELDGRGVRARYDLASIGIRTHRIENIVLGDPRDPDLTAKWVEVDLTLSGLSPGVAAVRAGGVRLHGSYHAGVLTLGELDKFRDPSSSAPFSLPDMDVSLNDARMRLDTDAGQAGLKLDGAGNLQDGFSGQLAAVMPRVQLAGCTLQGGTAYVALSMRDKQPSIKGPVKARDLACASRRIAMARPVLTADITLDAAFRRWTGQTSLSGEHLTMSGATFVRPSGRILFDGNAGLTRGQFELVSGPASGGSASVEGGRSTGTWVLANGKAGLVAQAQGTVAADSVRFGDDPLAYVRKATAGTPVAPLAGRLADAVRQIGQDNHVGATFAVEQRGSRGQVTLTKADAASRSGSRIALGEGTWFILYWPQAEWALNGALTMEGGGLPAAALRLSHRPDGGAAGQLFVEEYAAGGARLALDPVRFTAGKGGETHFTTVLLLDGPMAGGGLHGLHLPIDGHMARGGRVAINPFCTPVEWDSLAYSGFSAGRTRLSLCPQDGGGLISYGLQGLSGGATVRAPRIEGRLGQSPMRLAADSVRLMLAKPGFEARNADFAVGPVDAPVRLTAVTLSGAASGAGMKGTLAGAGGRIGTVPLDVTDASGQWSFAGGKLKVNGALAVSDIARPHRFNTLSSRDFALTMKDSRILSSATLVEPRSGQTVLLADIVHDLRTGGGKAELKVPGITFSPRLQPEAITPLSLGVVANARGTVSGQGEVAWKGDKVTSTGTFRTDRMDLAAAFGPVTGFSGEVRFTDLVGLVTAPGQIARIANVNPGVEVTDGVVRYQLIPEQKVKIESGEWPFSGGRLMLLPTRLDFSADTERYLTFRVIGLEAGEFINKMQLENISATGVFDGIMPLIFNAQGGRIAGGVLVARQTGLPPLIMPEGVLPSIPCDPLRQSGTLSYVGPVSNEQVGVFGKLAFDALKNLQYKCLTILMDGALDGELVTNVVFNGINRGAPRDAPKSLARNFIGLPFLFNIRIEAPFRGLMGTAKSFLDPSDLVRNSLGDDYQQKVLQGLAVQPPESDTVRPKEQR
jgi:hypothetical protein